MFGLPDTVHIFNWLQNRYKRQKTSKKWVLGRLLAFIKAKIVFTRRIFFIGQINANLSTFLASSNVFFRFFRSLGIRAKKLFCFIVGKKLLFLWRYHAKELNNVGILYHKKTLTLVRSSNESDLLNPWFPSSFSSSPFSSSFFGLKKSLRVKIAIKWSHVNSM